MLFFCMTSAEETAACAASTPQEELLARIAQGDRDALAQLYEQTRAAVYGTALSILKNAHDAEDVLQDTFVRIYRSAGAYSPQGKPLAWIVTVARNLALMALRERKRALPQEAAPAPAFFSASDDRAVLQAAAQALGDEELQIVMLHAVAGLRHREIAAMLRLPVGTVLSKYARAIKKLSSQLREA